MAKFHSKGEVIGNVGGLTHIVEVTLSVSTSAYTANDLMADAQEIANAVRNPGGTAILQSVHVLDKDDEGAAFDIYLTDVSTSWGTENAEVAVSDAVAGSILGSVSVAASDYTDLVNSKEATIKNIGLPVKAAEESTSLYVACVARGTPTYAAATDVVLKFGFLLD